MSVAAELMRVRAGQTLKPSASDFSASAGAANNRGPRSVLHTRYADAARVPRGDVAAEALAALETLSAADASLSELAVPLFLLDPRVDRAKLPVEESGNMGPCVPSLARAVVELVRRTAPILMLRQSMCVLEWIVGPLSVAALGTQSEIDTIMTAALPFHSAASFPVISRATLLLPRKESRKWRWLAPVLQQGKPADVHFVVAEANIDTLRSSLHFAKTSALMNILNVPITAFVANVVSRRVERSSRLASTASGQEASNFENDASKLILETIQCLTSILSAARANSGYSESASNADKAQSAMTRPYAEAVCAYLVVLTTSALTAGRHDPSIMDVILESATAALTTPNAPSSVLESAMGCLLVCCRCGEITTLPDGIFEKLSRWGKFCMTVGAMQDVAEARFILSAYAKSAVKRLSETAVDLRGDLMRCLGGRRELLSEDLVHFVILGVLNAVSQKQPAAAEATLEHTHSTAKPTVLGDESETHHRPISAKTLRYLAKLLRTLSKSGFMETLRKAIRTHYDSRKSGKKHAKDQSRYELADQVIADAMQNTALARAKVAVTSCTDAEVLAEDVPLKTLLVSLEHPEGYIRTAAAKFLHPSLTQRDDFKAHKAQLSSVLLQRFREDTDIPSLVALLHTPSLGKFCNAEGAISVLGARALSEFSSGSRAKGKRTKRLSKLFKTLVQCAHSFVADEDVRTTKLVEVVVALLVALSACGLLPLEDNETAKTVQDIFAVCEAQGIVGRLRADLAEALAEDMAPGENDEPDAEASTWIETRRCALAEVFVSLEGDEAALLIVQHIKRWHSLTALRLFSVMLRWSSPRDAEFHVESLRFGLSSTGLRDKPNEKTERLAFVQDIVLSSLRHLRHPAVKQQSLDDDLCDALWRFGCVCEDTSVIEETVEVLTHCVGAEAAVRAMHLSATSSDSRQVVRGMDTLSALHLSGRYPLRALSIQFLSIAFAGANRTVRQTAASGCKLMSASLSELERDGLGLKTKDSQLVRSFSEMLVPSVTQGMALEIRGTSYASKLVSQSANRLCSDSSAAEMRLVWPKSNTSFTKLMALTLADLSDPKARKSAPRLSQPEAITALWDRQSRLVAARAFWNTETSPLFESQADSLSHIGKMLAKVAEDVANAPADSHAYSWETVALLVHRMFRNGRPGLGQSGMHGIITGLVSLSKALEQLQVREPSTGDSEAARNHRLALDAQTLIVSTLAHVLASGKAAQSSDEKKTGSAGSVDTCRVAIVDHLLLIAASSSAAGSTATRLLRKIETLLQIDDCTRVVGASNVFSAGSDIDKPGSPGSATNTNGDARSRATALLGILSLFGVRPTNPNSTRNLPKKFTPVLIPLLWEYLQIRVSALPGTREDSDIQLLEYEMRAALDVLELAFQTDQRPSKQAQRQSAPLCTSEQLKMVMGLVAHESARGEASFSLGPSATSLRHAASKALVSILAHPDVQSFDYASYLMGLVDSSDGSKGVRIFLAVLPCLVAQGHKVDLLIPQAVLSCFGPGSGLSSSDTTNALDLISSMVRSSADTGAAAYSAVSAALGLQFSNVPPSSAVYGAIRISSAADALTSSPTQVRLASALLGQCSLPLASQILVCSNIEPSSALSFMFEHFRSPGFLRSLCDRDVADHQGSTNTLRSAYVSLFAQLLLVPDEDFEEADQAFGMLFSVVDPDTLVSCVEAATTSRSAVRIKRALQVLTRRLDLHDLPFRARSGASKADSRKMFIGDVCRVLRTIFIETDVHESDGTTLWVMRQAAAVALEKLVVSMGDFNKEALVEMSLMISSTFSDVRIVEATADPFRDRDVLAFASSVVLYMGTAVERLGPAIASQVPDLTSFSVTLIRQALTKSLSGAGAELPHDPNPSPKRLRSTTSREGDGSPVSAARGSAETDTPMSGTGLDATTASNPSDSNSDSDSDSASDSSSSMSVEADDGEDKDELITALMAEAGLRACYSVIRKLPAFFGQEALKSLVVLSVEIEYGVLEELLAEGTARLKYRHMLSALSAGLDRCEASPIRTGRGFGIMMRLLTRVLEAMKKAEVKIAKPDVFALCLRGLDYRLQRLSASETSWEHRCESAGEADVIEREATGALLALVLKVSEADFRSLLTKLLEWSESASCPDALVQAAEEIGCELSSSFARGLPLFTAVEVMQDALRVIFAPYFALVLDQCLATIAWKKAEIPKEASERSTRDRKRTRTSVVADKKSADTLAGQRYVARFRQDMVAACQRVVGQYLRFAPSEPAIPDEVLRRIMDSTLESFDNVPSAAAAKEYSGVRTVLSELGSRIVAIGAAAQSREPSRQLLGALSRGILVRTRSEDSNVRLAAVETASQVVLSVGDEYLAALPEAMPFLADLVDDETEEVESAARRLVKTIEGYSGEPIMAQLK